MHFQALSRVQKQNPLCYAWLIGHGAAQNTGVSKGKKYTNSLASSIQQSLFSHSMVVETDLFYCGFVFSSFHPLLSFYFQRCACRHIDATAKAFSLTSREPVCPYYSSETENDKGRQEFVGYRCPITSHSAYVAMSMELDRVKIDGFYIPYSREH